jgi:transposase
MNLGRLDTGEALKNLESHIAALIKESQTYQIFDVKKHLNGKESKQYGQFLVFKKIWQELSFDKIISACKKSKAVSEHQDILFNMVLNRLSEPCSKRKLTSWQENIYGINHYDAQQYYRAMDFLEENKETIEKGIFKEMHKKSGAVDVALFDTTTVVYYGEGDKEETLLANGFSKAKRGDLKQVVVGVVMSGDGIPIGYEVFSGNTNDLSCFKQIIDKISNCFKLRKVILVGDRGMISDKNIKYLENAGYQYILGYRMRKIPKKDRAEIFSKADLKIINKDKLQSKEINYNGQRLVFCYNPERACLDAEKRKKILDKLEKKITSGKIKSLVTNQDYKRFLKIKDSVPSLDEDKIKRDELYDGVYVLTTNTDFNCSKIIESYKGLWQVEMAFRNLKSELDLGPLYHWKDRRIRAHIFICFLSLILRNYLYQKIKKLDDKISYGETVEDLKSVQAMKIEINKESVVLRTDIKPLALTAFKALKMQIPKKILVNNYTGSLIL